MELNLLVCWYDRKPDFAPDYDSQHHGTIKGHSPSELMTQLNAMRNNHDLSHYTQIEIVYLY